MPEVSVVIPTCRRYGLLRNAIQSVLAQTHTCLEVHVVDDANQQEALQVVNSFQDDRVRYAKHDSQRGEAAARNTGIRNSTGKYIAFLDDDDVWFHNKLAEQIPLFEKGSSNPGIIYSGFVKVLHSNNRVVSKRIPARNGNLQLALREGNAVGTPSTVVVRKDCFDAVGLFDERLNYGVDYDMWIRLAKRFEFDFSSEVLVKYIVHDDQITNDSNTFTSGQLQLINKYQGYFTKKVLARKYLQIAISSFYGGRTAEGRDALRKAILLQPTSYRPYVNLVFSMLGSRNMNMLRDFKITLSRGTHSGRSFNDDYRTEAEYLDRIRHNN